MDNNRPTIIDFVEKYSRTFPQNVYIREKVDGVWKEITQEQTREEAYRIGAGLMALGVEKGDKIALLSESRAMWVLSELGAMYAGATDVPLSVNLGDGKDLLFRIHHSEARWILVSANQLPKIRAIIGECPQVQRVIVFDDTAFFVDGLQEGETATEEEVKEFCRARVAKEKIPQYVVFVDGYPMNEAGKIQKFKMREEAVELLGLQDAASVKTA